MTRAIVTPSAALMIQCLKPAADSRNGIDEPDMGQKATMVQP